VLLTTVGPLPADVCTVIGPVEAPAGTAATSTVELTVEGATCMKTPVNFTYGLVEKFAP